MARADDAKAARARNARRYRLDKAWRFLKKANRPIANNELAAHLGATMNMTAQILARLKWKGKAKCIPAGRASKWVALGSAPPESHWGMAEGSRVGIEVGHQNWYANLMLANKALGRNVPIPRTKHHQNVSQFSREGAPAETVRIPTLAEMLGVKDAA